MNGRINYIENCSRRDLLSTRLCDLGLTIKESDFQPRIDQLYAEIADKGIRFKPHVWISTSWFCPYGVPGFAVPFYLLHPRLTRLEKDYMGEVEGGTQKWCMQLLRHEAGHAIDNAFHLRKSRARQQLFGLSGDSYPLKYSPNPNSHEYVRHLGNFYAQAHPDEDWAETFAVWLTPNSNWPKQYQGWAAIEKLQLADRLLTSIYKKRQLVTNRETMEELSANTQTLREYFEDKQSLHTEQHAFSEQKLANKTKDVQHDFAKTKLWIFM